LESELDMALARQRHEPPSPAAAEVAKEWPEAIGYRHGHRERQLMGTFGPATISVSRARLTTPAGGAREWKNATIPAYQRRTKQADVLIAGAYVAGTNTRRVRLDKKATSISVLVALGVRQDGQKVLLAIKRTWVEKAKLPGGLSSIIVSGAA
jgi:putative transposase